MKIGRDIDAWLDALRRDKRLIFVAAGAAQKAADSVLDSAVEYEGKRTISTGGAENSSNVYGIAHNHIVSVVKRRGITRYAVLVSRPLSELRCNLGALLPMPEVA